MSFLWPIRRVFNTSPFHVWKSCGLLQPCSSWILSMKRAVKFFKMFSCCVFLSCHICVWSESTLWGSLNVKDLLARNRHDIIRVSDCNRTQTHNHLVCKRTLNHFTKLSVCGFESHSSHPKSFGFVNLAKLEEWINKYQ